MKASKKVIGSIVLVTLALVAATRVADKYANEYSDQAISRSLVAFAIARGMNGIISVAQGTEVAIHPAGLGLNFAPGQVLDPVNDLLEQFSWVMLACASTLGLQKILLSISATGWISVVFCLLMAYWLIRIWWPQKLPARASWLLGLTLVLLFMRFSVLISAFASESLYSFYLAEQYDSASERLKGGTKELQDLNKELSQGQELENDRDKSFVDKAKQFFNRGGFSMDYEKTIERYKNQAEQLADSVIDLIVVFVIQSIFFPIVTLWFCYWALKKSYVSLSSSLSPPV